MRIKNEGKLHMEYLLTSVIVLSSGRRKERPILIRSFFLSV